MEQSLSEQMKEESAKCEKMTINELEAYIEKVLVTFQAQTMRRPHVGAKGFPTKE